ncbi:MAG: radical SAM protein [Chlorobiaceae bacterium]
MSTNIIESLINGDFSQHNLRSALLLNGTESAELGELARDTRDKFFPNKKVEVRSVIEISNICSQNCMYCNMGRNKLLKHYELTKDEITNIVEYIYKLGRRFILLQSGENSSDIFIGKIANTVYELKQLYPDIIIILCIGSLSYQQYNQLKSAGADRYILKFETSNEKLFSYIKPGDTLSRRLNCINDLISLGFNVGSGNITGIPGQSLDDIVEDLLLIHKLDLKMNSTTVFIPAENSAFSNYKPGNVNIALNMMAIMRIMNPLRLLPTTSSLEKVMKGGQLAGLNYGANTVTIHDGTPTNLKLLFPIYSTIRVMPECEYFIDIVNKANMIF